MRKVTSLTTATPTNHPQLEQCLVQCQTAGVKTVIALQPEKTLGPLGRGFTVALPPLLSNNFFYLKIKTEESWCYYFQS